MAFWLVVGAVGRAGEEHGEPELHGERGDRGVGAVEQASGELVHLLGRGRRGHAGVFRRSGFWRGQKDEKDKKDEKKTKKDEKNPEMAKKKQKKLKKRAKIDSPVVAGAHDVQRQQAETPVTVRIRQGEAVDRVGEHRVHGDALQEAGLVRVGEVRFRGCEVGWQGPARLADGGGCAKGRGDGRFAVGRPNAHAEGRVGVCGHGGARAALYRRRRRGDILMAERVLAVYKRTCVHI